MQKIVTIFLYIYLSVLAVHHIGFSVHYVKNPVSQWQLTIFDFILLIDETSFFSSGRNERGREMLSLVEHLLEITPTISSVCMFVFYVIDG